MLLQCCHYPSLSADVKYPKEKVHPIKRISLELLLEYFIILTGEKIQFGFRTFVNVRVY